MGMKQILVMMTAVVLVGCGEKPASSTPKSEPKIPAPSQAAEAEAQVTPTPSPDPVSQADEKLIADPIVEKAVRESLEKPKGEITEADLEKVTRLQLGLTKITDAGLKDVAKLQKLTFLGLFFTEITDAGLKDVAKLQKLEILDLEGTQITDAGLKEVAKLQNLWHLTIKNTKITKASMAELKKALPNCEISGP